MSEKFEYINVKTGEKFLSELSPEVFIKVANEKDCDLEDWFDRVTMDKHLKDFLNKVKDVVLKVGDITVKIGKFLINFLFDLAETFKDAIKGAVVGAALGILFMQIPLIGWIFGPLAITTFAFAGAVAGLCSDLINLLTNKEDREKLKKMILSTFTTLTL